MLVREKMTMKHLVLLFGVATLGSMSFPETADAASPAFECPHASRHPIRPSLWKYSGYFRRAILWTTSTG